MKRHFTILVAALLLFAGVVAADYVTKVHSEGPDKLVVESGGTIEIKSGATLDAQVGSTLNVPANMVALTTDTTGNYVTSVATTAPLTGGAAGSEGATLTVAITADGIDGTQLADNFTQDGDEVIIGGTYDFLVVTAAAAEAGVPAASGNAAVVRCLGGICQAVMTLTAVSVAIADPTGAAGYGGTKIYDFPQGYINILGLVADLTATAGAGGLADAWDGDISFGTTVADVGAGLAATEADWVASTSTTQAAGGVAVTDAQSAVTNQTFIDGHTTAADLFINFETDDADTSALDTLAVSGTVTVTWLQLGDN